MLAEDLVYDIKFKYHLIHVAVLSTWVGKGFDCGDSELTNFFGSPRNLNFKLELISVYILDFIIYKL